MKYKTSGDHLDISALTPEGYITVGNAGTISAFDLYTVDSVFSEDTTSSIFGLTVRNGYLHEIGIILRTANTALTEATYVEADVNVIGPGQQVFLDYQLMKEVERVIVVLFKDESDNPKLADLCQYSTTNKKIRFIREGFIDLFYDFQSGFNALAIGGSMILGFIGAIPVNKVKDILAQTMKSQLRAIAAKMGVAFTEFLVGYALAWGACIAAGFRQMAELTELGLHEEIFKDAIQDPMVLLSATTMVGVQYLSNLAQSIGGYGARVGLMIGLMGAIQVDRRYLYWS
jgi:hypothetical protein